MRLGTPLNRRVIRAEPPTMPKRDDEIVRAWNRVQKNWWAWEAIYAACRNQPRRAWRLLGRMADLASSEELITDLGAGPLEDFIRDHAPKFIRQIEHRATPHVRFRRALRSVYLPRSSDDVSTRLFALGVNSIKVKREKWQAG